MFATNTLWGVMVRAVLLFVIGCAGVIGIRVLVSHAMWEERKLTYIYKQAVEREREWRCCVTRSEVIANRKVANYKLSRNLADD